MATQAILVPYPYYGKAFGGDRSNPKRAHLLPDLEVLTLGYKAKQIPPQGSRIAVLALAIVANADRL